MAAAVQSQMHRPHLRRNSPLSVFKGSDGFSADAPALQRFDVGADDSDSDDEPPPPMVFSKVTQALLNGAPLPSSPPPKIERSASAGVRAKIGHDTPVRAPGIRVVRRSSPGALPTAERGFTPPRIVQIGAKGSGSVRRTISISGPYPQRFAVKRDDPTPTPEVARLDKEVVTPAPAPRAVRVNRTRAESASSQSGAASRPGSRDGQMKCAEQLDDLKNIPIMLGRSTSGLHATDNVTKYGSSTVGRSRNVSAETGVPPGSQRIKRAPIGTGSFLKSGPVRRGFRRRDSEDNNSPNDEYPSAAGSQQSAASYTPREGSATRPMAQARSRSNSFRSAALSQEPVSVHDFGQPSQSSHDSRPSSRQGSSHLSRTRESADSRPPSRQTGQEARSRQPSAERYLHRRQPSVLQAELPVYQQYRRPSVEEIHLPGQPQAQAQRQPSLGRAQYRYAAPKMHTDAAEEQENMPPPTFKRNKDQEFKYLGKPAISVLSDDEKPLKQSSRTVEETPVPVPMHQQVESRRPLAGMSSNTPHRAAPAPPAPPPKMSMLDGATATTKSKKKRQHVTINGKTFTQMGRIGRGGSSDVYCVMADNYKTFALKRVKLADCDESAVRGFRGEIDLLKRLVGVERVVRLYDWELNEARQELCVLMERGETDLNRALTQRLNTPDATFDSAFARFYWREMLECVAAVHAHDIVHSDLKPANFLLVAGRLKLIDFGIANAIDTDVTLNVHRDAHVGTPNYMSPESITDTNAPAPGDPAARAKKDMALGKPSDVWSLGCILYQMAYSRPPFAHIPNQIARVLAITNPAHAIAFPATGVGGAPIPPALRSILRRCLDRDPARRPSLALLLSDVDPWLYPDAGGSVPMGEDVLGQIILKVYERCRDARKGMPTEDEVRQYPASFMGKIREMMERA